MLTGESLPVEKKKYSSRFRRDGQSGRGTQNESDEIGEGTVLAQIVKTVEEAQGSKAPIQKLADKISGIFVPVIILVALATFLGWYFFGHNFSTAMINAVSVLVIACPCALGLATPTAIMVGTGRGAKAGILFKSGESFERSKDISMVVFDKTGTLTKGKPEVIRVIARSPSKGWINSATKQSQAIRESTGLLRYARNDKPVDENKILKIAASLAKNSEHPLSKAIANYAEKKNIILAEIRDIREMRGRGVDRGVQRTQGANYFRKQKTARGKQSRCEMGRRDIKR